MTEFDVDTIYRQYAAAYAQCTDIEQRLAALEAENPDCLGGLTAWELIRDGGDAFLDLLILHHRLCMCISLDIAAIRANLQKCGVFVGDEKDGKTIQTELEYEAN